MTLFCSLLILSALSSMGYAQAEPEEADKAQLLAWPVPRTGGAKLLPDISLVGAFAGGYFRNEPTIDQGENPQRTGLNMQSLELGLQQVIDPYIRGDVFIIFQEDSVEVKDATVTTLSLPAKLKVRVGKMLARFGRQNTLHIEQLVFIDQSFLNRFVLGPEGFSELGVELSLGLPTPWSSELTFEFLEGDNGRSFKSPKRTDFVYLGHWQNAIELAEDLSLRVGVSGALGVNQTDNLTQLYGADFDLNWRLAPHQGFRWQSEYMLRSFKNRIRRVVDGGFYTQLVGQWSEHWEAGIRYEMTGLPKEFISQQAISPVVTFLASEYFKLRAQYSYMRHSTIRDQHQGFLQLIFNMGTHGGHVH